MPVCYPVRMTDRLDQFSTAYLHQRLDYNPLTGVFVWNRKIECDGHARTWNGKFANDLAGHWKDYLESKYLIIKVGSVAFHAHRIAWKMTFDEAPPVFIDHIDRNTQNNRISNLRLATRYENRQNLSVHASNSSGAIGVTWNERTQKWTVRIRANDESYYLGRFYNKEEAIAVRRKAELELFGEFAPH